MTKMEETIAEAVSTVDLKAWSGEPLWGFETDLERLGVDRREGLTPVPHGGLGLTMKPPTRWAKGLQHPQTGT